MKPGISTTIMLSFAMVAGCGGAKILKEPQPIHATQSLAAASDSRVTAILDWVVVRDGPGSWARNADWDEYRLRIDNKSGQGISLNQVIVVDSLQTRLQPKPDRRTLVKASKDTARRYKDTGIRIKAGRGAATLVVAGTAMTAVGVGGMTAVAYSSMWTGGSAAGAGATAASGLLFLGPAIAVGGVVRGINNSKVNNQIELRQTELPIEIAPAEELRLSAFFPFAPSPKSVELIYSSDSGMHSLVVDTSQVLEGLHLVPDD
jgi:hypothetical protein